MDFAEEDAQGETVVAGLRVNVPGTRAQDSRDRQKETEDVEEHAKSTGRRQKRS